MSSSMISGWPDAIMCTVNGWGKSIFYLVYAPLTSNFLFYYRLPAGTTTYAMKFNSDGTYYGDDNVPTHDCTKTITQLIDANQAFNFLVSV